METDGKPWDALSRAGRSYSYTLYCARQQPRCGHTARADAQAMIARVGDRTWRWVRRRARCTRCGHLGADIIVTPTWTGPPGLDPGHPA